MKKSINIWSFHGDRDLKEKMQLAKSAGFEGFEIDLSEEGPVHLSCDDEELETVDEMATEVGIELSGLATDLYWEANPCSDDPSNRKRARNILRKQIECASKLGIDTILVVPGAVGADFLPDSEVVPYDLAIERARSFIEDGLPVAEKHQVTIGIENVWNKMLLSPHEMRDFIDSFQSEYVRSYFDVGNALANGYPEHWISVLGDRIERVHVKDYRRAVGTVDGFVDLLSGDVNWPAVVEALESVNYDGWVAAEMIPPVPFYSHHPEVLIENTSRAMDAILN